MKKIKKNLFLIGLLVGCNVLSFAQQYQQKDLDSAFVVKLDSMRADIADLTAGMIGHWVDRKGKGRIDCTPDHIQFIDRKGNAFGGTWEIEKILIGYQLIIYNENREVIKELGIHERTAIMPWMLEIHQRRYIKDKKK